MSDPSKSREMKERWRDPEYRARTTLALHEARAAYLNNLRSMAESTYRRSRFNAEARQSQSRWPLIPRTVTIDDPDYRHPRE